MPRKIKLSLYDKIYVGICYVFMVLALIIVLYPLIYVLSASVSSPVYVANGRVYLFPRGFTMMAYREVFKVVW